MFFNFRHWMGLASASARRSGLSTLALAGLAALFVGPACRPSVGTPPTAETPAKQLQPGDQVPDFAFTDQTGKTRRLSESGPRAVVLNFIFTRCGVKEFCPHANRKFTELRAALDGSPMGDRVELFSVSLDPEHDTPEVLGPFADFHNATPGKWTFATMPVPQTEEIKRAFGLWTRTSEDGTIDHNLRTAVIGFDGRVLQIHEGNRWTNEEILDALGRGEKADGIPGDAVSVLP